MRRLPGPAWQIVFTIAVQHANRKSNVLLMLYAWVRTHAKHHDDILFDIVLIC